MTDTGAGEYTIISKAFEGDLPPANLGACIVSLVELCQLAMPDPVQLRKRLSEAEFTKGPDERAADAGRVLALDNRIVAGRVANLSHEIYGKVRNDGMVVILLSVGDGDNGQYVFCSTLFRNAIEADVVKAVAHVAKKQPLTGSRVPNDDNFLLRRVFWDIGGEAGIQGMVASGPANVEETRAVRAITAFNKASVRR
jgi:hypothetical protein